MLKLKKFNLVKKGAYLKSSTRKSLSELWTLFEINQLTLSEATAIPN